MVSNKYLCVRIKQIRTGYVTIYAPIPHHPTLYNPPPLSAPVHADWLRVVHRGGGTGSCTSWGWWRAEFYIVEGGEKTVVHRGVP